MTAREILAFQYAEQGIRSEAESFLEADPNGLGADYDFYFWAITGSDPIVVDCGFDARTRRRPDVRLCASCGELLQSAGIEPAAVKQVVLTHLHYDHVGCLDLFPNATFFVQSAEVQHCTSAAMQYRPLANHYRNEHISAVLSFESEGRLCKVNEFIEIADGISLHLVPGHTPGQQIVRVKRNRLSPTVIASDALHLYSNLERRNPFPILTDLVAAFGAFDELLRLANDDASAIIPGHDAEVRKRYPAAPDMPLVHKVCSP